MNKSIFNIPFQHDDINAKTVIGLERISEAFRTLLWEHAKEVKLSPIQIQILIFVAYHDDKLCTVSHLAKEFNLTKPTISDAVKVLEQKEMISKNKTSADSRSYFISLTKGGQQKVSETELFANPIKKEISKLTIKEQESLFSTISTLIHKLHKSGVITIQRTCYACKYYESKDSNNGYCNLIKKDISSNTVRLDCPEFAEKA